LLTITDKTQQHPSRLERCGIAAVLARKGDAHQTGYSHSRTSRGAGFFTTVRTRAYTENDMTFDEYIAQAQRYEPPQDFDAWLATAERVGG